MIYDCISKEQLPEIFGGKLKLSNFWPPLDTFEGDKERLSEDEMVKLKLRPFYTVDEYDCEIFGEQLRKAQFDSIIQKK